MIGAALGTWHAQYFAAAAAAPAADRFCAN